MLAKCLLALAALARLANAQLDADNLVFSEVLFKPASGARASFVELYNPTGGDIDVRSYRVCTAANACTNLGGILKKDSYYVLCSDLSVNMFCRQATEIQLGFVSQLFLFKGTAQVDSLTVGGTIPTGQSYTRGKSSNLLTFSFTTDITLGIGFLGGQTTTSSPSASPFNIPGVKYLGLNELSTESGNRFVEIAYAATLSISGYVVTFYSVTGTVLSSSPLSDFTVGEATSGLTFATLNFAHAGSTIGVALTADGFVIDFISKGGEIKAIAGNANGATSTNLGTSSIYQQRGSGCDTGAFDWLPAGSTTKGRVNQNQFPACDSIVFINEINYSLGSGNYLEVAYSSGLDESDLSKYAVELYERATGQAFIVFSLDEFTRGSTSNGLTFAWISLDVSTRFRRLASLTFQGFSLTNFETGELLSFFSTRGTLFRANSGGAKDRTSINWVVNLVSGRLFGGYTGTGCSSLDFAFGADGLTRGAINNGQTIQCAASTPNTDVLSKAPSTIAPTPAPTPFPTLPPTQSTNECLKSPCHKNAICTDTVEGFTCTCLEGFSGNGFSCVDIDECTVDGKYPCAVTGGFCVDEDGSFKCGCLSGYTGDGFTCTDINECATNPCGPNASCLNIGGSFSCPCNTGYAGNGKDKTTGCTDINECAQNPCGANADCTNSAGGFVCACKSGFTGNGQICTDVNECSTNPCSSNANCVNTAGSFTCTCKPGFTGNGLTCTVISPAPTVAPVTTKPTTATPTTAKPTKFSNAPSGSPTISSEPSISEKPSITSNPSLVPSLSDEPSETSFPSISPSLSEKPSITDMPSSEPSKK